MMFAEEYKVKDILKIIKGNEKYPTNKRWNKESKAKLLFNDPRITDFSYVNFYNIYMLFRMFKITKVDTVSIHADYENKLVRLFNNKFTYNLKMIGE